MTRAIAPNSIPELPEGATQWRRSLRHGSMFHAHTLGFTACRKVNLERHTSRAADNLGDLQYWGVCPICFKKGGNS